MYCPQCGSDRIEVDYAKLFGVVYVTIKKCLSCQAVSFVCIVKEAEL